MYRRDLRDTEKDGLLADMAMADLAVQAAPSPTADRIAYAQNREDQTDLWLHNPDGTDRRLTSEGVMAMRRGRGDQQWLSWSPDGTDVAFLSAEGTLSTVDTETGEVTELTHHDDGDLALDWGEHGIALVTDAVSRASLTLVDPETGSLEVLADDEFLYGDPRWGADGLYAVRARHRDLFDFETALVRVPVTDGELAGGPETLFFEEAVRVQNPRPHPDGDGVAFVHDATGFDELFYADGAAVAEADADGSVETEALHAEEETEVAAPAWHPDGNRLAATATQKGRANVRVVTLDGDVERLSERDEMNTAPFWFDGDVHTVRGNPTTPPQVWNASAGEPAIPTGSVGFEERLAEPTEFSFRSGGRDIHTVVYPPVGGFPDEPDSVPLLVHPHGGPTAFDDFGWDYRSQYFAALGYAVAMPNYRGSDGYGRDHRNANDDDWGGGDLDDVIGAGDATADEFTAVDGDRVGIFGGSGGGLMTVNALGNTDRFDAGAAFYGVYDYETFVDDTDDIGWQLMKRELGDLATDLENYREASPIRHVPDIEDPVLVLHGEEDARVPMSQSEQLCDELEKHDKRHELQRYDGEPHGFSQRENVLDAYTRCADLFAKYLDIDPDDGSSSPHPPRE